MFVKHKIRTFWHRSTFYYHSIIYLCACLVCILRIFGETLQRPFQWRLSTIADLNSLHGRHQYLNSILTYYFYSLGLKSTISTTTDLQTDAFSVRSLIVWPFYVAPLIKADLNMLLACMVITTHGFDMSRSKRLCIGLREKIMSDSYLSMRHLAE